MTASGFLNNYDTTDAVVPQKEKHVVFAPRPIIYKSVPWKLDFDWLEAQTYNIDHYESSDMEIGLYFSPNLKLSNDVSPILRTPYRPERVHTKIIPALIILLCLSLLFLLIWWVADKLLLLEIEKQVSTATIKAQNQFFSGLGNKLPFKKRN